LIYDAATCLFLYAAQRPPLRDVCLKQIAIFFFLSSTSADCVPVDIVQAICKEQKDNALKSSALSGYQPRQSKTGSPSPHRSSHYGSESIRQQSATIRHRHHRHDAHHSPDARIRTGIDPVSFIGNDPDGHSSPHQRPSPSSSSRHATNAIAR
jgi:hypothetical protein